MKVLLSYLKEHRWVVVLALVLAAFNIGFSLLDPFITGIIVDKYIVPTNLSKGKVVEIVEKIKGADLKALDHKQTGTLVDTVIKSMYNVSYHQFIVGVLTLIGLAIGAAMVSRIAKNFQDYYTNIITQKVGLRCMRMV